MRIRKIHLCLLPSQRHRQDRTAKCLGTAALKRDYCSYLRISPPCLTAVLFMSEGRLSAEEMVVGQVVDPGVLPDSSLFRILAQTLAC